ncbi:uncharacterized protein LOC109596617 isoform X2 [Aethina tumida]|uniref:uncharacterized protein LOC109596617 isoform X2 n=1 Tax=Aethina tumida TaxID=116153 RepID=UPI00096B3087|nr:uncharacterized protein LOC109596617 isoform X2 [Aethina tumida]
MGCLGECLDLGPPPDSILFMPPPPVPDFLQHSLPELLLNTTPCWAAQICEPSPISNKVPDILEDYVELPRKDIETWSVSGIDDTWIFVLVASSIGVLLLGALLAMFLLKCREMNMFGSSECSLHARDHRPIKNHETRDCSTVSNLNSSKLVHPSDTVFYHGTPSMQDNRMVWAALTPRGTQHFISENYPRDLLEYGEPEDHYETIDNVNIQPVLPQHPGTYHTFQKDYDYEDPTPLIESYQMNDMENGGEASHYQIIGNTDMRCASLGLGGNTLRRAIPIRPRVSSPTRIEHPNLPPLNLYPHKNNTFKKNNTISYRNMDTGTLPKYGC